MMLIPVALYLVAGYLVVRTIFAGQASDVGPALIAGYAVGLGLGASSILVFVGLVWFNAFTRLFVVSETAILTLLIVLVSIASHRLNKNRDGSNTEGGSNTRFRPFSVIRDVFPDKPAEEAAAGAAHQYRYRSALIVAFFLVLFLAIVLFIFRSLNHPHGGCDAHAIWNLRARFLFRGTEDWLDHFSAIGYSHPDYPLLVPLNVAGIWFHVGRETPAAAALVAFAYTFATVMLLVSSLTFLRGRSQGLLAGLTLLGFTFFTRHGASQYADVPLGFYILACLSLIYLQERAPGKSLRFAFLAGVMAGFAAWTKNEGILFLGSVPIGYMVGGIPAKGWRPCLAETGSFCFGALPALAVLACFKSNLAPANDLLGGQDMAGVMDRAMDLARYLRVAKGFLATWFDFLKGRIVLFLACLFLLGIARAGRYQRSHAVCAVSLAVMAAGYFAVYIVTPHDLAWHLDTSLKRLFLQLFPSVLLVFFVLLSTPEEAMAKERH